MSQTITTPVATPGQQPATEASNSTMNSFSPMSSFNAMNIPDMIINTIMAREMSKIFNNFTFTKRNVLSFVFMIFLGEIKKIVSQLLTETVNIIKKSPTATLIMYTKCKQLIGNQPIRRLISDNDIYRGPNIITLEPNHLFLCGIYNYINTPAKSNKSTVSFDKIVTSIKIVDAKERLEYVTISQLQIANITICNDLNYVINIGTGEIKDTRISNYMFDPKARSCFDFFTKEQQDIIIDVIAKLSSYRIYGTKNHTMLTPLTQDKLKDMIAKNTLDDYLASDQLFMKYIFNKVSAITTTGKRAYDEYELLEDIIKLYPHFKPHETILFICGIIIVLLETNEAQNIAQIFVPNSNKRYTHYNLYYVIHVSDFAETLDQRKIKDTFGSNLEKVRKGSSGNTKTVIISVPQEYTELDKTECVKKFMAKITKYQTAKSNTIKIYSLGLETVTETSTVDNPEYEQWLEKKKMIEEMTQDKAKSACTIDISSIGIPPKTLTVEKQKRVVIAKQLNETTKDMDTLYLRQADKKKLYSSINQFKNKAHLFKKLGIQKKLNIMLYGEPGTGKSTTIIAVATYLEKDIYYVDLKNAKCNDDLQIMIEYVNKHVSTGGIVVLEDIDAMTTVVHKRAIEPDISENINKASDTTISLEYFLNILQGSLTLDESVFIVTTNHLSKLDPAFYRDGRFDVKLELRLCDRHQISSIYKSILERDIDPDVLSKIPEDKYSPATVIFHLKDYILEDNINDIEIMAPFCS